MDGRLYTYDSNGFTRQYTVMQAAEKLGVSRQAIGHLIRAGELDAFRTAGNAYLIDSASLNEYERLSRGRGRPLSSRSAWAALWYLSNLEVNWLTYQQERRLKINLASIATEDFLWAIRKRATSVRLWVDESFLTKAKDSLVISGASAEGSSLFGLTTHSNYLEGYIAESQVADFIKTFHADYHDDANTLLRVTGDGAPHSILAGREMPSAVVAADLASSSVSREQSAGLEVLEELFVDWRN